AVVGVADVHARPLAHGVEALEDLDRVRAVLLGGGVGGIVGFVRRIRRVSHQWSSTVNLPASTRTPRARPRRPSNSVSSVPVRKACSPSATISSKSEVRLEASR